MNMPSPPLAWHRCALPLAFAVLVTACGGGSEDKAADAARAGGGGAGGASPVTPTMRRADATREEVASAAPARKVRGYDRKGITAMSLSPSGDVIGMASADGKVSVVDAKNVQELRVLKAVGGLPAAGLVFSGDSQHVVGVGRDSVAQVWNVESGQKRFALQGHEHPLRCVAASLTGSVIATAGDETRVMVWDGSTGRLKQVLRGAADVINALAISPDARLLASGGADARVLVFDMSSGRVLNTLLGHADEISAVAFSPDGRLLASAGQDGKVLLWDVQAGRQLAGLQGQGVPVRSLAFNDDGRLLAGGLEDGRVVLWSPTTFGVALEVTASSSGINAVAFDTKNKNRLFIGDQDNRLASVIVPASVGK